MNQSLRETSQVQHFNHYTIITHSSDYSNSSNIMLQQASTATKLVTNNKQITLWRMPCSLSLNWLFFKPYFFSAVTPDLVRMPMRETLGDTRSRFFLQAGKTSLKVLKGIRITDSKQGKSLHHHSLTHKGSYITWLQWFSGCENPVYLQRMPSSRCMTAYVCIFCMTVYCMHM